MELIFLFFISLFIVVFVMDKLYSSEKNVLLLNKLLNKCI